MSNTHKAATDTLALSLDPKETYQPPSSHPPCSFPAIRLGNGGAGPTGLLRALASAYHASFPKATPARTIEWYQNISPLTLRALSVGALDITLTYERDQEVSAIEAGWADSRTGAALIFNDHFLLVGPSSDPAGLREIRAAGVQAAFRRLGEYADGLPLALQSKGVFISRNDESATNLKEREIWAAAGVQVPAPWYIRNSIFPIDALKQATEEGLYLLTDHGSWTTLRNEIGACMAVYACGGDILRNQCCALIRKAADQGVLNFLSWLRDEGSYGGQVIIEAFDAEQGAGPLFTRARQLDF